MRDTRGLATETDQLERLLEGDRLTKPLSVILHGTDLQVAVWRALIQIPSGAVATYAQLATRAFLAKAKAPTASRLAASLGVPAQLVGEVVHELLAASLLTINRKGEVAPARSGMVVVLRKAAQ